MSPTDTWYTGRVVRLSNLCRQMLGFMGLSFDTISSTGPNAAVIHYKAPEQGSSFIDINQVYLCDSGAQYLDGQSRFTDQKWCDHTHAR